MLDSDSLGLNIDVSSQGIGGGCRQVSLCVYGAEARPLVLIHTMQYLLLNYTPSLGCSLLSLVSSAVHLGASEK